MQASSTHPLLKTHRLSSFQIPLSMVGTLHFAVDNHAQAQDLASVCRMDLMMVGQAEALHMDCLVLRLAEEAPSFDSMDPLQVHKKAVEHSREERPVFHLYLDYLCSSLDSLVEQHCSGQQFFQTHLEEHHNILHMDRCWQEVADDILAPVRRAEARRCLVVALLALHLEEHHNIRQVVPHSNLLLAAIGILGQHRLGDSQMVDSQVAVHPAAIQVAAPHNNQQVAHHNIQKAGILVALPSCPRPFHR
mmetsp:Transcript_108078/g.169041  ORF Transcript_108078/g.169041 Transcript_108078/m.169041 type:complete len:248 (+) Transcript_108078:90-833(+)